MISSENDDENSSDERRKGKDEKPKEIILASWRDRFLAWLIDFIIVFIVLAIIFAILFAANSIPTWVLYYENISTRDENNVSTRVNVEIEPLPYIISSLIFFGYWIYFESTSGQSIGKMVLRIKITDLYGNRVTTKSAAIESFGKAFLLPIDVIVGRIFTNNKRQRIFNRLSNTIVIKLKPRDLASANNRYMKD